MKPKDKRKKQQIHNARFLFYSFWTDSSASDSVADQTKDWINSEGSFHENTAK